MFLLNGWLLVIVCMYGWLGSSVFIAVFSLGTLPVGTSRVMGNVMGNVYVFSRIKRFFHVFSRVPSGCVIFIFFIFLFLQHAYPPPAD
jgi:hypothetical protein